MMHRIIAGLAICACLAGVLGVVAGRGTPRTAEACTGGFYGPLEHLAESPLIVLADVRQAGDAVNRAPTLVPTWTPSATPTPRPGTASSTPPSPPHVPNPPPRLTPEPFDLTGYGATLDVVRVYAGDAGSVLEIDTALRAGIERGVRQLESMDGITDCGSGKFAYRYTPGQRYLVFAGDVPELGLTTFARFRIEGGSLIPHDADIVELSMRRATYIRFFSGIDAEFSDEHDFASITAGRVPLASMLRAIAALRGDPSIAPPDTGSAGLADPRLPPARRLSGRS